MQKKAENEELAAELEQTTAKKMKKNAKNQENCVQNIEPKNLYENINNYEKNKESKINNEMKGNINLNDNNQDDDKIIKKIIKDMLFLNQKKTNVFLLL